MAMDTPTIPYGSGLTIGLGFGFPYGAVSVGYSGYPYGYYGGYGYGYPYAPVGYVGGPPQPTVASASRARRVTRRFSPTATTLASSTTSTARSSILI